MGPDKIENVVKKMSFKAGPEMNQQIWADVSSKQERAQERRITMNTRIARFAAVAAIITIAVLIGIYLFGGSIGRTGVAWADVVREMQQIRTATWTEIGEPSPPKIEGTIRIAGSHIRQCAYKAPGHERQDTTQVLIDPRTEQPTEFKLIHIIDRNVCKALILNPQEKTASVHSFDPGFPQNPLYDVFLNPPENIPSDAQSLGTKQIDNRQAIGFRLQKKDDGTYPWSGDITDIWVDAKTRLLVMLEIKAADGSCLFRLTDFVFNEDLDDSLFSLEPPPGYTQTAPPQIRSATTREEGK